MLCNNFSCFLFPYTFIEHHTFIDVTNRVLKALVKKLIDKILLIVWPFKKIFVNSIWLTIFKAFAVQRRIQRSRKIFDGERALPFMVIKTIASLSSVNFATPLCLPL